MSFLQTAWTTAASTVRFCMSAAAASNSGWMLDTLPWKRSWSTAHLKHWTPIVGAITEMRESTTAASHECMPPKLVPGAATGEWQLRVSGKPR